MKRKTLILILLLTTTAPGVQIVRSRFHSSLLGSRMDYFVALPADYHKSCKSGTRFPVVYLLHCAGGAPQDFLHHSRLAEAMKRVQLIVAMPYDGSGFGWWIDSPVRAESKLSSFLALEFKPLIDSLYSTDPRRVSTGIAGHSMGGFGAFHNLARHPEIFGVVFGAKSLLDLIGNSGRYGLTGVLGVYEQFPAHYHDFDIITNSRRYAGLNAAIRFYSGPSDWFVRENRRFHAVLDSLGVAHHYFENGEGHFPVAPQTMAEMLKFFHDEFGRARPNKTDRNQ